MRPTLLVVILAALMPIGICAQMYTQYFDGADTLPGESISIMIDTTLNNSWQIGPPQKTIFSSALTLPNALVTDTINAYPVNDTSSFRLQITNAWNPWGVLALQWMQKLDLERGQDGGMIEFSVDGGTTWQDAFNDPYVYNFYGYEPTSIITLPDGSTAFSGTDTTWRNIWLCFDMSWMAFTGDTLDFRFTLVSDSIDTGQEGWLIDNFMAYETMVHTVNEVESASYMTVSPTLTTGRLDISTEKLEQYHLIEQIDLVNADGIVVQQWRNTPTKFRLDIGHHPDGIYLVRATTNVSSETHKVVLQH